MLTDFWNFFTDRLSGKFATNSYLNIPPHLKCVCTLLCKISIFKTLPCSRINWSKLPCKTSPFKKLFQNICLVNYPLFNSLTKGCSHQPYKKSHCWLYTTAVTKKKTLQQNAVHDSSRSVTHGICLSVSKSKNWSTTVWYLLIINSH